jgi:hypothetical protein
MAAFRAILCTRQVFPKLLLLLSFYYNILRLSNLTLALLVLDLI